MVLVGSGGERYREALVAARPSWLSRVIAPGPLPAAIVAEYIMACDLMIQPYPDGASSRRTTLMAPLASGVPVLTTLGALSEPFWAGGPVATAPAERLAETAVGLLDDPAVLRRLGRDGRRLYDEQFTIDRTLDILLRRCSPTAVV
jgi:glycosyltransferase involved in cell wall biosynthesis